MAFLPKRNVGKFSLAFIRNKLMLFYVFSMKINVQEASIDILSQRRENEKKNIENFMFFSNIRQYFLQN